MSAVILGAVEPLIFRPTVRREPFMATWEHFNDDLPPKRIVPPNVPDFSEPCPDCSWNGGKWEPVNVCSTCNGSGVGQQVWRAERQWNTSLASEPAKWTAIRPGAGGSKYYDTRTAVVAWHPVTFLPVVDHEVGKPAIWPAIDGGWVMHDGTDPSCWEWKIHEPWAADLVPGCVVVIPGDEVRLDEPITEMRVRPNGMAYVTRPLALAAGLNEIELAP